MPPGLPPMLFPDDLNNHSPENLSDEAAKLAHGLRAHLTISQRRPIAAYGRCLIAHTKPTRWQVQRFINALRRYPSYRRAEGRLRQNLATLRLLQDEIARRVALGE